MRRVKIIDYLPEHQPYFESLNRAWIEKLFVMEPVDEWILTHPDEAILDKGGAILMATYDNVIAGTVGLRKLNDTTYEFIKMAVHENYRRRGIAEALTYASFEKASQLGAHVVVLYSNTKNETAVKMYEKIGFHHEEVEKGVYDRANVKMTISIEDALQAANNYYQQLQA